MQSDIQLDVLTEHDIGLLDDVISGVGVQAEAAIHAGSQEHADRQPAHLDGLFDEQPVHRDLTPLGDAVHPRDRLLLDGRVQRRLQQDHVVGTRLRPRHDSVSLTFLPSIVDRRRSRLQKQQENSANMQH